MLSFYRQSKLIWFALFALSLLWLLPLIQGAQLAAQASNDVQPTLCSSVATKTTPNSETPPVPQQHISKCPICISNSTPLWALPAAPAALPSVQQHTSLLRQVGSEGFFIPAALYTLPQSQAPPLA
ncbi:MULTISPECIES: DUF2946 family protein [Deefgea]|uniref:DUF2946 domain-containing protein n=1 Tax=Deefgea chitinilytica TaxID=570276 RepID=A0ABS2CAW0_9NEIS|nr:DUF2946 domain-containing protein [Deefgea chitinilytica]MBM9888524.1 DUF2946 family protein [Deefgea sp. CFH1-16]